MWAERQREKSLSKASEQMSREEITDQKTPRRQLAEEGAGTAQPMSSTMTSNPETASQYGQRNRAQCSGKSRSMSHTRRILDMCFLKSTAEGAAVLP